MSKTLVLLVFLLTGCATGASFGDGTPIMGPAPETAKFKILVTDYYGPAPDTGTSSFSWPTVLDPSLA